VGEVRIVDFTYIGAGGVRIAGDRGASFVSNGLPGGRVSIGSIPFCAALATDIITEFPAIVETRKTGS
jgi:hypothetical protein